ncbi:MAG: hypothetical protein ACXWCF_06655 [Kaistella sp.]
MKDLDSKTAKYLTKKTQIDDLKNAVKVRNVAIVELGAALTDAQGRIQEINKCFKDSEHVFDPFNLGEVATILSADEALSLKTELGEKESAIRNFNDSIRMHNSAIAAINAQLALERITFNGIMASVAEELSDQAAIEISVEMGEQIKKLACTIFIEKSNKRDPRDLYQIIGIELCKRVFGVKNAAAAKLPDIFEARRAVDEIIENLA